MEFVRFIRSAGGGAATGLPLFQQLAKTTASLHGLETLAAVRRWQIAHKALPRNLATACREAGLKAVPIDPFSGQPMKFVVDGGQPVVYSSARTAKTTAGRSTPKTTANPAT